MKKFFAILAIAALASCGGSESTEATADTAAVTVDTTATVVDTAAAIVDTAAKAAADTTKK